MSSTIKNDLKDLKVIVESPMKHTQGDGNMTNSTEASNNTQEDVSVRKRSAGEDGGKPAKRMRCSNPTNSTEHNAVSVEDKIIQSGKRTLSVDARTSTTQKRCSINNTNTTDPSTLSVVSCQLRSGKRKTENDGETPKKRARCSDTNISEPAKLSVWTLNVSDSVESSSTDSSTSDEDRGNICHNFGTVSSEEEKIFEMSSSASTSRDEFKDKYIELTQIGTGGFGTVYYGFRREGRAPVAIKHIARHKVKRERVICNGKTFDVILEVAFMLKAAGLPGSSERSAAVKLLDWYLLDHEFIMVMERPASCMDLSDYLDVHGEFLDEHEAKMILKQLVDAAIDLHSKGIFHRDIKLENVLIQMNSAQPRVRIIDFGCGSFSMGESFHSFCGTRAYAPPEWFEYQTYWARHTTVWQLGALFYLLLQGHGDFTTLAFINNRQRINSALSKDCKTLLKMCLKRDPLERISLEELQQHPALN